jgi:hypothetical protein
LDRNRFWPIKVAKGCSVPLGFAAANINLFREAEHVGR